MAVLLITTGGSIDKTYSGVESELVVGAPAARAILREAKCSRKVHIRELFRKDSLEITDDDRQLILETVVAARESAIVITHGTDTMAKTAMAIQAAAVSAHKTVIITGSHRPYAFRVSDATFNVGMAVGLAPVLPPGAHIVVNGTLFSEPSVVQKDVTGERFFVEGDSEDEPKEKKKPRPRKKKPPPTEEAKQSGERRGGRGGRGRGLEGRGGRGRGNPPPRRAFNDAPAAAAEETVVEKNAEPPAAPEPPASIP